jgi:hypothetical protein
MNKKTPGPSLPPNARQASRLRETPSRLQSLTLEAEASLWLDLDGATGRPPLLLSTKKHLRLHEAITRVFADLSYALAPEEPPRTPGMPHNLLETAPGGDIMPR